MNHLNLEVGGVNSKLNQKIGNVLNQSIFNAVKQNVVMGVLSMRSQNLASVYRFWPLFVQAHDGFCQFSVKRQAFG